jgi:D-apionolactonase
VFPPATGFSSTAGSTPAVLVQSVRRRLIAKLDVPVFGGTNQFFAEINRDPPAGDGADGTAFSLNPQVHAGDDRSLIENLPPQAETVAMTRALAGDRPIAVTPITLAGRSGPYPGGPPDPDALPGSVDLRQASLLGAVWTAMSVKHLAAAGAASMTYYETAGWRGLIERDGGSPRPELFHSEPGDVFPLYHVLADIGELSDAQMVSTETDDNLRVDALALRRGEALHLLLTNLTPQVQPVVVGPVQSSEGHVRVLDESTAILAKRDAATFRERRDALEISSDGLIRIELAPYAYVRIDGLRHLDHD